LPAFFAECAGSVSAKLSPGLIAAWTQCQDVALFPTPISRYSSDVQFHGYRFALAMLLLLAGAGAGSPMAQAQAVEPEPPAPAASGDPAPEVQAEYRDVVARAVTEFDAGRWAEARALFLHAHELWPSARTFRTLGMTSFELRAYAQALSELQTALTDPRRPLPDDQRAQVQALIEQARAFVGRYRVQLTPASAELRVDGAPVALGQDGSLLLEVGRHELRARAPGYVEQMRRVDVQGREDEALVLELQPEQIAAAPIAAPSPAPQAATADTPHSHKRLWTWIAAGTAVALGGTSTALWLASDSKYDKEFDRCHTNGSVKPTCTKDAVNTSWQDLQTAHYVTLGLAIGAGVAAVALFFVEGGTEETPQVSFGPSGAQVRARF
jgi:hypothetical protein